MDVQKNTPLICTADLSGQKQFYQTYFGFKTVFDAPNYLALKSKNGSCEIAFMPAGQCGMKNYDGGTLTLCLQVDNVDKAHDRLAQSGLNVVQPPTDTPWGDRSAVVLDPIGISLYLYEKIPMREECKQFLQE
ncbi:MAG: VOC family protein [Deltaproteobacteria bacterium]|nr:VOC family protein [Deltaproteobacteria bacterium]MBN2671599.1 VOC family protein [Deltaproteobacteria bacterium]